MCSMFTQIINRRFLVLNLCEGSLCSCREEGIILKDLDSKWEPTDRSGKWLKLKPDYVHTGSDLDVLIIGNLHL